MIEKLLQETHLPLLEAEILLAHTLEVSRTYLRTWPLKTVGLAEQARFRALVARRQTGEPIAYLLGLQEFWSLPFQVSEAVLIPRPETEMLVEQVLLCFPKEATDIRILELGTGSGAIALSIAKERPNWQLVATDKSKAALQIAQNNAKALSVENVEFLCGDWFTVFSPLLHQEHTFHAIVSNPPYIAAGDKHLQEGDLCYEPKTALISGVDGLEDLKKIISAAQDYLQPEGWLLLEHGFQQALQVTALLEYAAFSAIKNLQDLSGLPRIVLAKKSVDIINNYS